MNVTYIIDKAARIVHFKYTGHPSFAEWAATMTSVFRDPDFQPGFSFLMDRRHVKIVPTTEYIRKVVAFDREHQAEFAMSRIATVVSESASFGMARMAEELSGTEDKLRVFNDIEEARRWLTSQNPPATAQPDIPSETQK